jgi:hypothetical protein
MGPNGPFAPIHLPHLEALRRTSHECDVERNGSPAVIPPSEDRRQLLVGERGRGRRRRRLRRTLRRRPRFCARYVLERGGGRRPTRRVGRPCRRRPNRDVWHMDERPRCPVADIFPTETPEYGYFLPPWSPYWSAFRSYSGAIWNGSLKAVMWACFRRALDRASCIPGRAKCNQRPAPLLTAF